MVTREVDLVIHTNACVTLLFIYVSFITYNSFGLTSVVLQHRLVCLFSVAAQYILKLGFLFKFNMLLTLINDPILM